MVDMLDIEIKRVVVVDAKSGRVIEICGVMHNLMVEMWLLGQSSEDLLFGGVEADILVLLVY